MLPLKVCRPQERWTSEHRLPVGCDLPLGHSRAASFPMGLPGKSISPCLNIFYFQTAFFTGNTFDRLFKPRSALALCGNGGSGCVTMRERLSVRGKHCTSQPVMPLPKHKSRSKLYLPFNCHPCSQSCIRWWRRPLRASKFSGFVLFQVPKVICGRMVAAIQAVTVSCRIAVFFAFLLGERRETYTAQEVNET